MYFLFLGLSSSFASKNRMWFNNAFDHAKMHLWKKVLSWNWKILQAIGTRPFSVQSKIFLKLKAQILQMSYQNVQEGSEKSSEGLLRATPRPNFYWSLTFKIQKLVLLHWTLLGTFSGSKRTFHGSVQLQKNEKYTLNTSRIFLRPTQTFPIIN